MTSELQTHYSVQLEVLSPVHIGNGQRLERGIDYITRNERTFVLNIDRFTHWAYDAQASERWMTLKPGEVLEDVRDLDGLDVFRYVMRGVPETKDLRAHIKTVYGNPYIPGSSLKGMLRTIFVWGLYAARGRTPDLTRLGKSRSWAGQPVERAVMGRDPNTDLFRAFQVRDSRPLERDTLIVRSVDVYPTAARGGGVVVNVEALREGTQIETRITVDHYGFSSIAARELNWEKKGNWVLADRIVPLARAFAEERIRQELKFYENREDARTVRDFYRGILADRLRGLEDNQFIAQLGWGGGWNSKTLNNLLLADQQQFARIVRDYRLTRKSNDFKPGTVFPKSRQLVRRESRPVRSMGWVLVTLG